MTAEIILGRHLQQEIVRRELMVAAPAGPPPNCRLISVAGNDPLLDINRALHVRTLTAFGFGCEDVALPHTATLGDLAAEIDEANGDPSVDGVMVLLPLPPHLSINDALQLIDPSKELEGLHPEHSKSLLATVSASDRTVSPLVTEALLTTLSNAEVSLVGQHVVILTETALMSSNPVANVVARVAGPASLPLDAPVSVVPIDHPRARDISRAADLLVVSLERPEIVDASYVSPGAVVVDFNPTLVGTKEVDGRIQPILKGGVLVDSVAGVASKILPAPGGVGPVMLGMLMRNLIRASRNRVPVMAQLS